MFRLVIKRGGAKLREASHAAERRLHEALARWFTRQAHEGQRSPEGRLARPPARGAAPVTTRDRFHQMMRERRLFPRGSLEWEWRTRAACNLARIIRGIPTTEWSA